MSLIEIRSFEEIESAYNKAKSPLSVLSYVFKGVLHASLGMFLITCLLVIDFVIAITLYFDGREPANGVYFLFVLVIELSLIITVLKLVNNYKLVVLNNKFSFLKEEDFDELKKQKHDVVFIADKFLSNEYLFDNKEVLRDWLAKHVEQQKNLYFDVVNNRKNRVYEVFGDNTNIGLISIIFGLLSLLATLDVNGLAFELVGYSIWLLVIVVFLRFLYVLARNREVGLRNKYYSMKLLDLKLKSI